jgi:hypothetical protein
VSTSRYESRYEYPLPPVEKVEPVVVTRPVGAPRSFECTRCQLRVWDGVDYSWCPRCSANVSWIDPALTHVFNDESPRKSSASHAGMAGGLAAGIGATIMGVCKLIQLGVLALDPVGRIYAAPLLLVLIVGAVFALGALVATIGQFRDLVRDRVTRVAHGLEHACIALLERAGHKAHEGQTKNNAFVVEIANDGRATNDFVRATTEEAIARVAAGQRHLAFTPKCGTSLLVKVVLASMVVIGATIGFALFGVCLPIVLGTILAALVATLLSRPLGLLAQRAWTVSTEFSSVSVRLVDSEATADGSRMCFVVALNVSA